MMKYMVCLLALTITGCGSIEKARYMGKNKLDVAPQFDYQVRHPEWGKVEVVSDQVVYKDLTTEPMPISSRTSSSPASMSVANIDVTNPNSSGMNTVVLPMKAEGTPDTLERFLARNNIQYESIPGEHTMIRLLEPIYFKSDSMNMTDHSRDFLEKVARYLASYQGVEMVVEGHTDNIGDPMYNEELSVKRAEAVKSWVKSRFRNIDEVYVRGYGGAMPACDNNTDEGKACNRRVEVFFILPA